MQYYKPEAATQFVGDCMPFFHDGTFHLYYLLDEDHHRARNGFGGHQWAHAASDDLVHWRHYPLAVPVGDVGELDYLSICTGSVFHHDGLFYAFYATRRVAEDGTRSEHLCRATSADSVHFTKDPSNPIASPDAWYDMHNFRDPVVFRDAQTGLFHMLVTACVRAPEIAGRAGCLAHLVSPDLETWDLRPPFVDGLPGVPGRGVAPECPDYFEWNGWYYLLFTDPPHATTYCMARGPLGPWIAPTGNALDTPMERVFKTAAFTGGRRLAVAFLSSLAGDKDDGAWEYAGNAIFRELVQHEDGMLGTTWPREMIPRTGPLLGDRSGPYRLAGSSIPEVVMADLPPDARVTLTVSPGPASTYFGLYLRASADGRQGYQLLFAPREGAVRLFSPEKWRTLYHRSIANVTGLDRPFGLDIVITGDIIDVCIDNRRCLCTRLPEPAGNTLALFIETGEVTFDAIEVRPLLD